MIVFKGTVIMTVVLVAAWSPGIRARFHEASDAMEDLVRGDAVTDAIPTPADASSAIDCCVREKSMKSIGVSDTTGEEISMDVGHCRKRCSSSRSEKLKRAEFQRLLRENPDEDPILLFQLHSRGRRKGGPSCSREGETCRPSSSRMEKVGTSSGVVSVTVTESCGCQSHPRNCRRQPRDVTLHKDTPLQATIDVGDCQGHCSHELGCRAIKSRSITVEGPNGSECLSVVEECGCRSSCYRTSHFQHVYNYTDGDDPRVEVIDVGTCVGECETMPSNLCVERESNGGCLMSLSKSSSRCAPLGLQELQVRQKDGSVRTLDTVTRCGCQ